jgi:hypothetical protein
VVDDEAVCTPVRPGPSDLTHTLVREGISAGDQVIIRPYKVLEKIKHGELVRLETDAESEEKTDEESKEGLATAGTEPADEPTDVAETAQ